MILAMFQGLKPYSFNAMAMKQFPIVFAFTYSKPWRQAAINYNHSDSSDRFSKLQQQFKERVNFCLRAKVIAGVGT